MTVALDIRRGEFLRLTTLLSMASMASMATTASCDAAKTDAQVVNAPLLPPVDSATTPSRTLPPDRPPPRLAPNAGVATTDEDDDAELPIDPSCSNANGNLDVCSRIGPACEGLVDECRGLTDLRPRVAQAFGECFAKAHRPGCRDKTMGACMRAAVLSACIEPGSVRECRRIMTSCRAAGKAPTYSLEECAKVVSAAMPSRDPLGWPRVDAERLGPTVEGGCSLRQVLPYQPWGPSWDGTFDRARRGQRP